MQGNKTEIENLDNYLYTLESLSSKIAYNISMGEFNEVKQLDLKRKYIIKMISNDAANLSKNDKKRIKLIWVNNNELVKKAEECISKKKERFNKLKKTFQAYSNN